MIKESAEGDVTRVHQAKVAVLLVQRVGQCNDCLCDKIDRSHIHRDIGGHVGDFLELNAAFHKPAQKIIQIPHPRLTVA